MATENVQSDAHSDYQAARRAAQSAMVRGVWTNRFEPRFVPASQRQMRCDLPREAIQAISEGKHFLSYRGIPLAKDPLDVVLYEMLFYEVQPRTIIELGAYTGASALWMADTTQALGLKTRIVSVDIDLDLVEPAARQDNRVTFLQGDCNRIEEIFSEAVLSEAAHPLILIDDAHVNIDGVYEHFHRHGMQPGDYLLVEDTTPWIPGTFGCSDSSKEWGCWKWEQVQSFLERHTPDYLVDRYYTDFFGYNATWNWNGFLRRF